MRYRRRYNKRLVKQAPIDIVPEEQSGKGYGMTKTQGKSLMKMLKSSRPFNTLKQVINGGDLDYKLMVILLTLSSDNIQMDRRIDTMSAAIEKIRNVTGVLNNTMQSIKTAAEAPRHIRRLLE